MIELTFTCQKWYKQLIHGNWKKQVWYSSGDIWKT